MTAVNFSKYRVKRLSRFQLIMAFDELPPPRTHEPKRIAAHVGRLKAREPELRSPEIRALAHKGATRINALKSRHGHRVISLATLVRAALLAFPFTNEHGGDNCFRRIVQRDRIEGFL